MRSCGLNMAFGGDYGSGGGLSGYSPVLILVQLATHRERMRDQSPRDAARRLPRARAQSTWSTRHNGAARRGAALADKRDGLQGPGSGGEAVAHEWRPVRTAFGDLTALPARMEAATRWRRRRLPARAPRKARRLGGEEAGGARGARRGRTRARRTRRGGVLDALRASAVSVSRGEAAASAASRARISSRRLAEAAPRKASPQAMRGHATLRHAVPRQSPPLASTFCSVGKGAKMAAVSLNLRIFAYAADTQPRRAVSPRGHLTLAASRAFTAFVTHSAETSCNSRPSPEEARLLLYSRSRHRAQRSLGQDLCSARIRFAPRSAIPTRYHAASSHICEFARQSRPTLIE